MKLADIPDIVFLMRADLELKNREAKIVTLPERR